MTTPERLTRFTAELALFFQETADFHAVQHPRVCEMLRSAMRVAATMHVGLERSRRRYAVAIVGLGNVGKSTLLNALFGLDIAPRRNGPCTAVPIEFAYGDSCGVTLIPRDDFHKTRLACADTAELCKRLHEMADESTGLRNDLKKIEVRLPHPLLRDDFVLVDTPGFGAVQADDEAGSHERSLRDYLTTDVAQTIWVALGEQAIGARELRFFEELLSERCEDLVLTGCEEWDQRDRERFQRRFGPLLRSRLLRMHFVSGTEGLGIPALEQRIRDLADGQSRQAILIERLESLIDDVCEWIAEYRSDARGRRLEPVWRPDSLLRFEAAAAALELSELVAGLTLQSRPQPIRTF